MTDYRLHDWTLDHLVFDWCDGRLRLILREFSTLDGWVLIAEGVKDLRVPRRLEWGFSRAINSSEGPLEVESGDLVMRIEVQSGDEIEIEAESIELVRTEEQNEDEGGGSQP